MDPISSLAILGPLEPPKVTEGHLFQRPDHLIFCQNLYTAKWERSLPVGQVQLQQTAWCFRPVQKICVTVIFDFFSLLFRYASHGPGLSCAQLAILIFVLLGMFMKLS